MSANWDRSGTTAFYFGNAAVDLAHLLPTDEFVPVNSHTKQVESLLQMNELMDQADEHMMRILEIQRTLHFYLMDLNRSF